MPSLEQKHAPIIIICGVLAISSASILIKWCNAAALVIAFYRVGISSLLYLGIVNIMHKPVFNIVTKKELLLTLGSGACLAFHFATWTTSLNYTTVASSVVLVQTSPIFVAIGAAIFLHEKLSLTAITGILLAIGGGLIIALFDSKFQSGSILGNSLALLGALGVSGYFLLGRRLRRSINTFQYIIQVYGSAAILLLLYILFTKPVQLLQYDLTAFGLLIAIALVPQAIGHTSFNWALKYYTAAAVSIMTLGESVGSSILAWILLNEPLPLYKIMGGIILLSGVVTILINERNRNKPGKNLTTA